MARTGLFLVIVITVAAVILALTGTLLPQQSTRWGMQGMMGGPMMNSGNQGYEQYPNQNQANSQTQMMNLYCHE